MNIESKQVVLTGASGGIGSAIARELDARGARLLLVGRNAASLAALKVSLASGRDHVFVEADLATAEGRDKISELAQRRFGRVDILINAAGINSFSFLSKQDEDLIAAQLQTNLLAPILLTRKFLPLLHKSKSAKVVNIGSSFGSIGFPGYSSYCASKFGLRGFSEALRRELADTTTSVLYVAPRATQTAMNSESASAMNRKLGSRTDTPEYVAARVVSAIEKDRDAVFLGWPEKLFVKLNALLPGLVDGNLKKNLSVIRAHAQA